MRFCHVKRIADLDSPYVPVQPFRRTSTSPWDGTYEYAGDPRNVLCIPGLFARDYKALEYTGAAWRAGEPVCRLFQVDGRWFCEPTPVDGGTAGVSGVWMCGFNNDDLAGQDFMFELDPVTLWPYGHRHMLGPTKFPTRLKDIGGDRRVVYTVAGVRSGEDENEICKFDARTMALLGRASIPYKYAPVGVGGGVDVCWVLAYHDSPLKTYLFRLNPDTLALEQILDTSAWLLPSTGVGGIGGTRNKLWVTHSTSIKLPNGERQKSIVDVDPDTGAMIKAWKVPVEGSGTPTGVDGTEDVVYYCDKDTSVGKGELYKLDPKNEVSHLKMAVLVRTHFDPIVPAGIAGKAA